MSDHDLYLEASGQLGSACAGSDFLRVAQGRLDRASSDADFFNDAIALCPKATSETIQWLTDRAQQAQAEMTAMAEVVALLTPEVKKQIDDAKADAGVGGDVKAIK